MEVKPGYKQTEVGIIPGNWDVGLLRDLVDPTRTIRYGIVQPGKLDPNGRFMVRGQDYSKGWVEPSELFRVSPGVEEPFASARIRAGDVLITIVGASTGRIAVVPEWLDGANLTQTTARIAPRAEQVDGMYCSYVLASPIGSRQVSNYLKGAAQPGLNCGDIEKFLIPLPPLPEQRAIAAALSDVDALLGGLDRLIAKKRDLKQATMQQLLTGQTRLPGFSGEWEAKQLGEVLTICHGNSQRDVAVADGGGMGLKPGYMQTEVGVIPEDWSVRQLGDCLETRPSYGINAAAVPYSDRLPVYIRITDISDDGHFSPAPRVSVRSEMSLDYLLADGDIVFARTGASVGKSYRYNPEDGPLVYAGFLIRVRPDPEKLLPAFASAFATTGSYWRWVRVMSMRSGQPGINGNEYAQLPIPLPPPSEQRAIAGVLSDMDAELAALEARRDKTRDLKQAMMQELLTGRTRLI